MLGKTVGAILSLATAFALGRYTQWESTSDKRLNDYIEYAKAREDVEKLKPALADCVVHRDHYRESLRAVNSTVVKGMQPSLEGYPFTMERARSLGMGGDEK